MGFSYCNLTERGSRNRDSCVHTDSSVAMDNFNFLKQFLSEPNFPEFAGNPLYLSGVSYAGVYVSTLAGLVMDDLDRPGGPVGVRLNLAGATLGNPTFRWGVEGSTMANAPQTVESIQKLRFDALGGHGFFSPSLYRQILSTCTFYNNGTVFPADVCGSLLEQMSNETGGYDLYGLWHARFSLAAVVTPS